MSEKNITDLVSQAAGKTSTSTLMLEGVLLIVLGCLAILLPFLFTVAITLLIGILLLVGGVVRGYTAFKEHSRRSLVWNIIAAIVAIVAGALVLFDPLAGAVALTAIIIALFIVEGITKIIAAFQHRPDAGWGWVLFAGVLDLVLGIILWVAFPNDFGWVIGLLVGISLLFTGWTAVMLAAAMRKAAKDAQKGTEAEAS
ncbi:MAG: HdeD family acid-resistance protein [Pseudomonadota bacterium]